MAVIYRDTALGEIGWRLSERHELKTPLPPTATLLIRFDQRMPGNRLKFRALQHDTGRYSLIAGPTLLRDGSPVSFDPSPQGSLWQLERAFREAYERAQTGSQIASDLRATILIVGRLLKRGEDLP